MRLERTVSWSQTRRDTNFAIPGYSVSAIIPRRGRKSKIFLSVVIYVVKAAFVPFSATDESPANAGVARLCGVSSHSIPDTATALPKQARYQLRYTRLLSYFIRLVVFSQTTRATNCANPGFLGIQFYANCGQICGHGDFLTTLACGGSAFIAGVPRDCGHGIFRLEGGATRTQIKRDTSFATPGYSISVIIPRRRGKSKIFLPVVIRVVKAAFVPFSAIGKNPANAGVARLCGISPYPVSDTATALPNLLLSTFCAYCPKTDRKFLPY